MGKYLQQKEQIDANRICWAQDLEISHHKGMKNSPLLHVPRIIEDLQTKCHSLWSDCDSKINSFFEANFSFFTSHHWAWCICTGKTYDILWGSLLLNIDFQCTELKPQGYVPTFNKHTGPHNIPKFSQPILTIPMNFPLCIPTLYSHCSSMIFPLRSITFPS